MMEQDISTWAGSRLRTLVLPSQLPPRLGIIAAGFPLEAVEEQQREALLDLLAEPGRYALRVGDDSMIEAGIFDGDFIVVQSQQAARDGDIVVALIDNEQLSLNRFRRVDEGQVRLQADNPAIPDRVLAQARVQIQGKVVGQLRRYP